MKRYRADWDLLNGYADDELPSADRAAFEERLRDDPALRRDLERVRMVKGALARSRPVRAGDADEMRWRRRAVAWRWAAAACVALMIAGTAAFFVLRPSPGWAGRATAMHAQLSRGAYVVEPRKVLPIVSSGRLVEFQTPDLTSSRLYLVDIVTTIAGNREALAIHYRGMRGCRLTIVGIEAAASEPKPETPSDKTLLSHWWDASGFRFAVLANGMDPNRFASIAEYAETVMRERFREDSGLRVAMRDSYETARPCA